MKYVILSAAVLAALVGFIFSMDIPGEMLHHSSERGAQALSIRDLREIEIVNKHGEFRLIQQGGEGSGVWRLADAPHTTLSPNNLVALLKSVVSLKLLHPFKPEHDVDRFGLKEPLSKLRVSHARGNLQLELGSKSSYLGGRYVRLAGDDAIYMMEDTLFQVLDRSKAEFVDKQPIRFSESDVVSISVTGKHEDVAVEKRDGTWFLESPERRVASVQAVERMLGSLRVITAQDFIDAPDARARVGLDDPEYVIALEFSGRLSLKPLVIRLVGADSEAGRESAYFSLGNSQVVYEILPSSIPTFAVTSSGFRERKILKLEHGALDELLIEAAGRESIVLKRENEKWQVNGSVGDPLFINTFLDKLKGLEASGFPKSVPKSAFRVQKLHIITKQAGKVVAELVVGEKVNRELSGEGRSFWYARVVGESDSFLLSEKSLRGISPLVEALIQLPELEGDSSV